MDFDKPKVYGDTSITDGLVFIFTLLSPTIILQGAEVDRQALGSRQLYFLFRSLPHDSRNLPHLHIQVETDRVLNLLLMETTFLCSVIPSTTS